MNDGVRRSLLIARVAKLQVEDEADLAADVSLALSWGARPGWGNAGAPVGEWVGEQPAQIPEMAMGGTVPIGWAGMNGRLHSEPRKA